MSGNRARRTPRAAVAAGAAALAVVLASTAGCGDGGPPKVAATVAGVAIPSERVEHLAGQWMAAQSNQALQGGAPGGQPDRKTAAKQVLGFVIRSVFLEHLAAQMGVQDNPTALENLAPEEVPAGELQSAGWSKTDLQQSLRDARLSKAIGEKVFPKVAVSDVELRQKYDRNADFFHQTWRIQARVAYFDTLEAAKGLQARHATGDAFDAAAKELGAKQAGSIGLVTPVTPLPQNVLDAVAHLAAGQSSDPLEGGGGYLVVLADTREDRAPMSFEDARPALVPVLEDEQRQQLFYDWFSKRLGEAAVKISSHYGKWDAANQVVT
ncbi:MAG TPA: peptidylprolyl isomerase [Acidimicrobiia bacterium]|nr:peptidylprolyl isomerase [Acidimicrobiia bacterium]